MTLLRSLALASLLAIGLTGCASSDHRTEAIESGMIGTEQFAPEMMGDAATSGPMDSGSAELTERSVIITGDIYLTVDQPIEAATEVENLVTAAGGRVDSRSESAGIDGENPSAYLWVRIPVDQLDSTLEAIEQLGIVESQSIANQDVTLQVVDLDARIAVLEESIERLRTLLGDAQSTSDIVEIETALSERQAQLDSLGSQRSYLTDQVQFASIGVDIRTPEVAPEREPDGFIDGIVAGWDGMLAFFAGTIVFLGVIVPWLGLIALGALIIAVIVRLRRGSIKRKTQI